ncbi:MAG: sugar phosphate isomerase/epimerase [Syntrophothermus sp.]|nr:sugar phosphate isomerase/epimerase [Syntrophothermus sp.]
MPGSGFQLGIFSWFGFVLPLSERLRMIKEAGFGATSVWWEDEQGYPGIKKENMPRMVRESGLLLENIHVPYDGCNALWNENRSVREAEVKKHIAWVEDCIRYDIPVMVMHIADGPAPPGVLKYGVESIGRILRVAEQGGIILALENTDHTSYLRLVLSEIESPCLGLCYDSSHDLLYNPDSPQLLSELGGRLVATHLSDTDGMRDRHWLPGQGVIDWEQIGRVFPQATYRGLLSLEVCADGCWSRGDPEAFIKKAYAQALRIGGLLTRSRPSDVWVS